MSSVNYNELRNAFEFVSSDSPSVQNAYICLDTGEIFWVSASVELEESVPDDVTTSTRYLAVPHKNELQLGQKMALDFINQALPGHYNTVASFFRKRGAYRRFKELLQAESMLEQWFAYEANACDEALRIWCDDNSIKLLYTTLP
jgi:hypothetical protein